MAIINTQDTFPKILLERAKSSANRPAIREKYLGIWQSWTWKEVSEEVKLFACGLSALGLSKGEKLTIIGDNRPRLYWSMAATQCLGSIPVPTYQDAVANEMVYVVDHSDTKIVVVENQEQVDKILEIKDRCPQLEYIIYDDNRGLEEYDEPFLFSFEDIQEKGRQLLKDSPDFFETTVANGKGEDEAIMLYTSGTTGKPKGVMLSYDNMVITARNGAELENLTEYEETLAYLPMAWVGDHLFSYAQSYIAGFCVSCPESPETVPADLREIGPTYYFAPPRVFESLLTSVTIRMQDAAPLKQKVFNYFMDVARETGIRKLEGKSISLKERLMYKLGDIFVYGPLKNTLGMSRIRIAYTAGEAIGPEIFDFYRSLGINIKQIYGQTEASIFITVQPDNEVHADTVGQAAPDVEIRIDEKTGEVLYRSPGVFKYYYKNADSTASTKDAEGWVYTGDAGFFTETNQLRIIDRAKDVGKFNNSKMFAPKFIENKLKFFPHIQEAVCFGNERETCTAFINIDMEAVGVWAEKHNIAYASYQELAAKDAVYKMVQESIEKVNKDLATDSMLSHSQITRFLILHKELDADDGELTRTRKVRRPFIADRYGVLIDALYSEQTSCFIETEVSFEDGRTGRVSADLQICGASTFTSEHGESTS